MKTLVNTGRPVVMTTNREPLDLQLSISQRSGDPLTQTQDSTAGLWSPDRQASPLVLDPIVKVYDPEKKAFISISTGYINWYVGEIKAWDSTTETGLVNTSSGAANYSLEYVNGNKTGSLIVRKNVNYTSGITLICVVSFTDSSRSEAYRVEESVMLTSENLPEEFYSVSINAPNLVEYRPLEGDSATKVLKAVSFKGSATVMFPYTNGIKYFWYYMNSGVWTLIPTNGTYAPYVSGQNTDTLTLSGDYIDHETIKVMIACEGTYTAVGSPSGNPSTNGYFEQVATGVYAPSTDITVAAGKTYYTLSQTKNAPDCDAMAQTDIQRTFPRIEVLPYCTGGSAVEADDTSKTFRAVVSSGGVDMSDADREEYVRLNWKSKPTNTNTVTDRGWGNECTIPASQLLQTGNTNVEVWADLGLLSPYELLVDDSPQGSGYVIDDSGSSSQSQNSGYVVGRS